MTPERWRQVEEILHAALSRAESDREALLVHMCAGDLALRREVESLLAQQASEAGFFDDPTVAAATHMVSDAGASLVTGRRLGAYQVRERIGVGGMGEVYRAHDTKLGRDVAIKILPRLFSSDPDRLTRFEREARVLASLNHPHIGAIYGLEEGEGIRALVLELIEGETLAVRITRGSISVNEAMTLARQIADALDAAHERGIVHRDLKPANIKITPDGVVKVIDFGLAKAVSGDAATADLTQSPTATAGGTREGVILGTAAYMSPEQARGQAVDKRTDIWAFGCVLYEMLAGRRAFDGETISDTIAAVLDREPDWSALSADVPESIRRLVHRCLEKAAKRRLHDIADGRMEIDDAVAAGAPVVSGRLEAVETRRRTQPTVRRRVWWAAVGVVIAAIAVGGLIIARRGSGPAPITVKIALPAGSALADPGRLLGPPVVSPGGSAIAVSLQSGTTSRLFVRRLESERLVQLDGTDGAAYPAWTADGTSISFFADDKLKLVPAAGGAPVTVCAASSAAERGAAWAPDGTVIFALNMRGIFRCARDGGAPIEFTRLDDSLGENSHRYPVFLPDSRRFLYYARTNDLDKRAVYLASLDPSVPRKRLLVADGQFALGRDAASGDAYLVTQQASRLVAQRFDLAAGEVTGAPQQLLDRAGQVSASDTGVLVLRPEALDRSRLTWYDRSGRELGTVGNATDYWQVELAPDDQHLAVVKHDYLSGSFGIWTARADGELQPVSKSGNVLGPVWLPDRETLVFASGRGDRLFRKRFDATAEEDHVAMLTPRAATRDISSDGRTLVGESATAGGIAIVWGPADGSAPLRQFAAAGARNEQPRFSPDGHLLAYHSNVSGAAEVFVAEFPEGRTIRVSRSGGRFPRWRADGGELFFIDASGWLVAADLRAGLERPAFQRLFLMRLRRGSEGPLYDVTANGQRFIAIASVEAETPDTIDLILNWPGLLRR